MKERGKRKIRRGKKVEEEGDMRQGNEEERDISGIQEEEKKQKEAKGKEDNKRGEG